MHALRDSLNEDVAVPRGRLFDLLVRLADCPARSGCHRHRRRVGDGNLHP